MRFAFVGIASVLLAWGCDPSRDIDVPPSAGGFGGGGVGPTPALPDGGFDAGPESCVRDDREPNDSSDRTALLDESNRVRGTLHAAYDVDWYQQSIRVFSAYDVIVTLDGIEDGADYDLSSWAECTTADGSAAPVVSCVEGDTESELPIATEDAVVLLPGCRSTARGSVARRVRLRADCGDVPSEARVVMRVQPFRWADTCAPYDLQLDGCLFGHDEPNDTIETAAIGEPLAGSSTRSNWRVALHAADDVDWIAVRNDLPEAVELRAWMPYADRDPELSVWFACDAGPSEVACTTGLPSDGVVLPGSAEPVAGCRNTGEPGVPDVITVATGCPGGTGTLYVRARNAPEPCMDGELSVQAR